MKTSQKNAITISNVNLFNGYSMLPNRTVIFKDGVITEITTDFVIEGDIIDGTGKTLMPGLFDAHTHTSVDSLRNALKFGVTTELEMMGGFTKKGRAQQLKNTYDIADVRSAGMALTAPGGHPDELIPKGDGIPDFVLAEMEKMTPEEREAFLEAHRKEEEATENGLDVTSIEGAKRFVQRQFENGADYFKIMIEDGKVMNCPGLPMISEEVMRVAVKEAHRMHKLVIAHVLTAEAAMTAVRIGVDGLAHLFIDRPIWTDKLVQAIAEQQMFVTPCLVLNSSIIGENACEFAHDHRVSPKLDLKWKDTMCSCFKTFPQGNMEDNYKNVLDLHQAGVPILVGTDVSVPVPHLGGLAHGASVHHEMQFLVKAGLSNLEAMKAATSVPAHIFNLLDRGTIELGKRADLVLVDGDPSLNISDSLSIINVWKEGISYIH